MEPQAAAHPGGRGSFEFATGFGASAPDAGSSPTLFGAPRCSAPEPGDAPQTRMEQDASDSRTAEPWSSGALLGPGAHGTPRHGQDTPANGQGLAVRPQKPRFAPLPHQVGSGKFGIVTHAVDRLTGELLACKHVSKGSVTAAGPMNQLQQEVTVMERLTSAGGHRNVVQLRALEEDESTVRLYMDLCEEGELYQEIVRRGSKDPLHPREAGRAFFQIVSGVAFCHALGVVHRDLKPENILLSKPKSGMQAFLSPSAMPPSSSFKFSDSPSTGSAAPSPSSPCPWFVSDMTPSTASTHLPTAEGTLPLHSTPKSLAKSSGELFSRPSAAMESGAPLSPLSNTARVLFGTPQASGARVVADAMAGLRLAQSPMVPSPAAPHINGSSDLMGETVTSPASVRRCLDLASPQEDRERMAGEEYGAGATSLPGTPARAGATGGARRAGRVKRRLTVHGLERPQRSSSGGDFDSLLGGAQLPAQHPSIGRHVSAPHSHMGFSPMALASEGEAKFGDQPRGFPPVEPVLKLADFGLALVLQPGEIAEGLAGSPMYMAPEVYKGQYDFKADLWSLGVILYVLLCSRHPFPALCPPKGHKGQQEGQQKDEGDGVVMDAPRFPHGMPGGATSTSCDLEVEENGCPVLMWPSSRGNIPEAAKGLVRSLLNVDPAKRPTAKKVLTHPWLCQCVYGGVLVRRKGASPLAIRSPAKGAICKPTPSKAVPGITRTLLPPLSPAAPDTQALKACSSSPSAKRRLHSAETDGEAPFAAYCSSPPSKAMTSLGGTFLAPPSPWSPLPRARALNTGTAPNRSTSALFGTDLSSQGNGLQNEESGTTAMPGLMGLGAGKVLDVSMMKNSNLDTPCQNRSPPPSHRTHHACTPPRTKTRVRLIPLSPLAPTGFSPAPTSPPFVSRSK